MDNIIIIISIIAIFLGFLLQSIVGFAASLISFPILLFIMDLKQASALMAILYVFFSLYYVIKNWKEINKSIVAELSIGIIIGMIIGVMLLKYANPFLLKKILGLLIILYLGYIQIKKKKIKFFDKIGMFFGFIGGIMSGLYSAGGPLLITYIYNKLENPKIIRATIIGSLAIVNFSRIPLMLYSKLITYDTLVLSLYVLPFFSLSLVLGNLMIGKINEKLLKKVLTVILIIASLSLIVS